ncbi:MAG: hypothetical protein KBF21_01180 [Thermoanaerobaculia bacterium]|nr:hypothetical protein [Thermoanaerobaculia bacterium]MBP9822812.1 hypothetical protein [Thermoanaerobaculia bacterium]
MQLSSRFAPVLLALLLAPAALHAWKPATQQAIALDAAQLAPPDLARLIAKHRKEYLRGAVEPLSDGNAFRHMKNSDGSGELDRVIAAELAAAIDLIRRHRPFAEVVARLGRLSHYVADANLPLNTANTDPGEGRYFRDFLDYADSARPRFAVVFYGLGPAWRSPRDVQAWTATTLARGRGLYPAISEEYRRIGGAAGTSAFDDRSTAFAVAAVSYSHAVSDVARALRYVWLSAGGADPREQLALLRSDLILLDAGAGR